MKKLIIILTSLFLTLSIFAQDGNLGLFLGASYYNGEVNPNKILASPFPVVGVFYRHNFNSRWALRIEANGTMLRGDDASSSNEYQQDRGYSFKTKLGDLGFGFEFNFLNYNKHKFTEYYFLHKLYDANNAMFASL